jgi:hypothetical protein
METRFEAGKRRAAPRAAIGQTWRALLIVAAATLPIASRADMDSRTAGYDLRATATAQLLAGMTPEAGDPVIDHLAELDVWKAHRDAMQAQWAEVRRRLDAMSAWRGQELKIGDAQKRTLLYPFSGPDFLNAWTMFPDHGRYVFFSLENAGRLPDLAALSPRQFAELLDDMRSAMQDIFQRNYFITDYMSHQLTGPLLKGSVPLIAAMMALEGERIVRVDAVDLFPQLSRAYADPSAERPRKRLKGALIQFLAPGSDVTRQLYYFSLDATDKALEFYPDFLAWVGSNRPATVFLKSASYLLHDNQFSKTRDMLLRAGDLVVQDDTGIPYHSLIQGGWQIKLFGQYEKPIHQLSYGYQPDLKTAWTTGADANPLPFPFGYHWRSGQSGVMIATKNPS